VFGRAHEILLTKDFRSELVRDNASGEVWLVRPVSAETRDYGVVVVNLGDEAGEIEAARRQIASILSEATDRLNRLDMSRTIRSAKLRAESDVLKDALIGSVSHELRTPLTSILGSSSVLLSLPEIQRDANLAMLAHATHEEAMRLNDHVQKLLQATRIKAQGIRPKLAFVDPVDIVNAALAERSPRLVSHEVGVTIAPDLPFIEVDSLLVEQVLCELLENAAKYSTASSLIGVSAYLENECVVFEISDCGQGLTSSEQSEMFRRPFRGQRSEASVVGSGLGLWIAQTLVAACGGTLAATSRGPGLGAVVSMHLPVKLGVVVTG
jgi:two-component system sensor histidine kinase KdpD